MKLEKGGHKVNFLSNYSGLETVLATLYPPIENRLIITCTISMCMFYGVEGPIFSLSSTCNIKHLALYIKLSFKCLSPQRLVQIRCLCLFCRMELGEEPLVETGAAVFREICYNYRDSLMAGILVAGWDKRKGGQIYSIPIGGMCVRQQVSIGGSGSSYIYGYVDANFKPGMTKEQCVDFVTKCKLLLTLKTIN